MLKNFFMLSEIVDFLPLTTSPLIFLLMGFIFLFFLLLAFRLSKWLVLVMFFGVISQSLTSIRSGLLYSYGLGFWGSCSHDGVWHLALINSLARHLNFYKDFLFLLQNPIFSGSILKNYHFLFDLLAALVHKITFLPTSIIYFQIFPLVLSSLLGILVFLLIKKLSKNNLSALLACFFAFFGGNFGWLVSLWRGQGLGGESMFWANQSISFPLNLQFFLSLILMLYGFYLYLNYLDKASFKRLILLSLVFGLIIGIKAYGGVIVLFGLGAVVFWELLIKRKSKTLKVFIGSLLVSLLVFLPNNWASSSLFVFSPLWLPRVMIEAPDRVGWLKLAQARQAYMATGLWLKWWLAEGLGLTIFFLGNLGTRIFALGRIIDWIKNWRKLKPLEVLLLACLLPAGLVPLFFIQKGNPWNSIQFFYYFQFIFGLLAALWLGDFLTKKKKWLKIFLLVLIIGLTIPTTIGDLKNYLGNQPAAKIGPEEIEALSFLKDQPDGIILTLPHNYQAREQKKEITQPLYIYETTSYVSAYADKQVFLEDEMTLDIMQVNWSARRALVEEFFTTKDQIWAEKFIEENKIKYLYLVNGQKFKANQLQFLFNKIFENDLVEILQIAD